jgi:hypothetical protein
MTGGLVEAIDVSGAGTQEVNGLYILVHPPRRQSYYKGPNGYAIIPEPLGRPGWRIAYVGTDQALLREDVYASFALSPMPPPHGWAAMHGLEPGPLLTPVEEKESMERTEGARGVAPMLPKLTPAMSAPQLAAVTIGKRKLPNAPVLRLFRSAPGLDGLPEDGKRGFTWSDSVFRASGIRVVENIPAVMLEAQRVLPFELQVREGDQLVRVDGTICDCGAHFKEDGSEVLEFARQESRPGIPSAPVVEMLKSAPYALNVSWEQHIATPPITHVGLVGRELQAAGGRVGTWLCVAVDADGVGYFIEPGAPGTGVDTTVNSLRVEGLKPGKEYEFAIAMASELGWSAISPSGRATLSPYAKLAKECANYAYGDPNIEVGLGLSAALLRTCAPGVDILSKRTVSAACPFILPEEVITSRTVPIVPASTGISFVVHLTSSKLLSKKAGEEPSKRYLGLELAAPEESGPGPLRVQAVLPGGLIWKCNALAHSYGDRGKIRIIQPGDTIAQVNGVSGDSDTLLRELLGKPKVLRVVRPAMGTTARPQRNIVVSTAEESLLIAVQHDDLDEVKATLPRVRPTDDVALQIIKDGDARLRILTEEKVKERRLRQQAAIDLESCMNDPLRDIEKLRTAISVASVVGVSEVFVKEGEDTLNNWVKLGNRKRIFTRLKTMKEQVDIEELAADLEEAEEAGVATSMIEQAKDTLQKKVAVEHARRAADELDAATLDVDPDRLSTALTNARRSDAHMDYAMLANAEDRLVKLQRQRERDTLCTDLEDALTTLEVLLKVEPPWDEKNYDAVVEKLPLVEELLFDGDERVKKVVTEARHLVEEWQKMIPANFAAQKVLDALNDLRTNKPWAQYSEENEHRTEKQLLEHLGKLREFYPQHQFLTDSKLLLADRKELKMAKAKLALTKAAKTPTEAGLERAMELAIEAGLPDEMLEACRSETERLHELKVLENLLSDGIRTKDIKLLELAILNAHNTLGSLAYTVNTLRPAERCQVELIQLQELREAIEANDPVAIQREIDMANAMIQRRMKYKGRKDKAAQAAISGARKLTTWESKMEQPPLWYMEDMTDKIKLGEARIARTQLVTEVRVALTSPKYEYPNEFSERLGWLTYVQEKALGFKFDTPDMAAESFPEDLLHDLEDAISEIEKATEDVEKKQNNARFLLSGRPSRNAALDAATTVEMVIEKGYAVGVSRTVLHEAENIVHIAGDVGRLARGMQKLQVALENVFNWDAVSSERLKAIEAGILDVKHASEALNTQPPTEMSVALAHVPWLKLEPAIVSLTAELNSLIDQNADMSAITTKVTTLNTALAEAFEAGLTVKSAAAGNARLAMDAAQELNHHRSTAEGELRAMLQEKSAARIRKCLVFARQQRVFEKILMEARIHERSILQQECLSKLEEAKQAGDTELMAALVAQADNLLIMSDLVSESRSLLKDIDEVGFEGLFPEHAGPFGSVTWRENCVYELSVKGEEEQTVHVFLTDTQEHDDMSLHVVTNSSEIEDFLYGYNSFLLPGFSVVAESSGLHMVRLDFRAEPGKRYFVVPSLAEDQTAAARRASTKKVGHVETSVHGTFRVSAACMRRGDLNFIQCGSIEEEFVKHEEFEGTWTAEDKTEGGPKGAKEPNRFWYRNPEFRLYVGSHHDILQLQKMQSRSELEIEEEADRKKEEQSKKHAESSSLSLEKQATKRSSFMGSSRQTLVNKRALMNQRKSRPFEEGTVFCCILRAWSPSEKDMVPAEASVIRNNASNGSYQNPYARVIANAINHNVITYADGSLEICATFMTKPDRDTRPYFIVPALSEAKKAGRFTLQILATGKFIVERVPPAPYD